MFMYMCHSIQNLHFIIIFAQNIFFLFFGQKYSTRIFLFYYDIANFGNMNFRTFCAQKTYSFTIAHCKKSVNLYQFLIKLTKKR